MARWSSWLSSASLGASLVMVGCGEHAATSLDSGVRAPASSSAGEPGMMQAPGPLPLLCAGCVPPMPGGDTSDFGQMPASRCDGSREQRIVAIDEADAAGLGVDAPLAVAEGLHAFSVRWADADRAPEPTRLDVEVRRTGRVQLTSVEPVKLATSGLPPCPPVADSALPEVEVRVQTADRAVVGTFVGLLEVAYSSPDVRPRLLRWTVRGDGARLRGRLSFAAIEEPLSLLASIDVVQHPDGERDDRGTFGVALSNTTTGAVLWAYTAVPLDGCRGLTAPFTVAGAPACDPWTVSLICCQPVAFQTPAPPPTARDEDAGTSR